MSRKHNRSKKAHSLKSSSRISPVVENLEPRLLLAADIATMFTQPLVYNNDIVIDGDLVLGDVGDVVFKGRVDVTGDVVINTSGSVRFESSFIVGGDLSVSGSSVIVLGGLTAAGDDVSLRSTQQTLVAASGTIDVSGDADAGRIVLWSDTDTTVAGSLIAHGSASGGDGGFIEVSSAGKLSLSGMIDTDATAGADGMLLIDPKNVIIGLVDDPGLLETGVDDFTDTPATDVNISVTTLLTWGDVTIQANNDITVNSAITMGAGDSLTLLAGRSVLINADITTIDEPLVITANHQDAVGAQRDGGLAAITMAAGTTLDTGSGDLTLTIATGGAGTGGSITVDEIFSTGLITVTSVQSILAADAGPEANFNGGTASLTANDDGGTIGLVGTPIRTSLGLLNLSTHDGSIYVTETDDIIFNSVIAREDGLTAYSNGTGQVVLDSDGTVGSFNVTLLAGGDIVFGTLIAPNVATITSTGGTIYDLDPTGVNITARTTSVLANGGIGQAGDVIETSVQTINATSTTGSVYLQESDGATLDTIAASGDVVLTTLNGTLTVKTITAGGTVALQTANGSILDGNGATVNITADGFELKASAGIGSASDPLDTDVDDLLAETTGSAAAIYITEADGLDFIGAKTKDSDVTITFTGGPLTFVASTDVLSATAAAGTAISFENTNGGIAVGVVNTGSADVTLKASADIHDDVNDAVADIIGGAVTLTAGTSVGAAGNELDTTADSLNVRASAGSIFIRQSGAFSLSATAVGSGNDIDILSAVGDMTLGAVSAPDTVTLSAGGAILDGNGVATNVTASTATLTAGTAIGTVGDAVETAVATLTATALGGGVFVSNSGALTVAAATATGGDMSISASGNLTLSLITAVGQTVTLTATGAIIDGNGAAVNIIAGTAVLSGSKIGTTVAPIGTTIGTLRADTVAGGIFVLETDNLTIDTVTALGSGSDVEIEAGGDIVLGSITAKGDDVVLTAGGAITDGNGSDVNITADTLTITAPGGIGTAGDVLELSVNKVDSNGGGGGGAIVNDGPLALTDTSLEGKGSALLSYEAESITILDMADNEALVGVNGSVVLRTQTGSIIFLDLNDTIRTQGTGTITIEAGLTSGSGAVAIVGNLTTAGGDITVTADGNVTIAKLDAGAGDVTVTSQFGVIVDGNGATVNIVAASATLTATTPSARDAQLTTMWAIADSSAARAEAAAKQSSADSFSSGAAITAAAQSAASQVLTTAQNDTAAKQSDKDAADDAVEPIADAVLALTIVSQALDIANTIAGTIAAVAQAVPFTGDGGSATVAFVITITKNATDIALLGLSQELDRLSGIAGDAATSLAQYSAQQYAAEQTYTLSQATAQAFQEASSIATADANEAAIASAAAAVEARWAVAAEDQGNAIGSADDSLLIDADQVDVLAGDGSVYISIVGNFELSDVALGNPTGQIVVEATGDIIVIGTITSPTLVSLNAGNRILDGGGQVIAPEFIAQAGTYIGTSADPIDTDVDNFAADGGAGGVFINNSGTIAITTVDGLAGIAALDDVTVASTGSITLEEAITAAGQTVTLTSTTGAIIDAHDAAEDVTAATLNATAATGIDIDTIVDDATAVTTGTGEIDIYETNGITITNVQTANGAITVTAGGAITATAVASLTDTDANDIELTALSGGLLLGAINAGTIAGDVTLDSNAAIAMSGGGRVTADVLSADSVTGMTLTTTVNAADLSVSGTGDVDVTELNAITLTSVDTADGEITVVAGGSIIADDVDAGDSDVSLTANVGTITMAVGGRITGGVLTADAVSGIDITTTVDSIDLGVSGAGNISVDELDAITLAEVTATDGDVTLSAGGTMTMELAGRVTGDALTADAVGGMTLTTTVATADLTVTGTGDLSVDEIDSITLIDVDTEDGDIAVTAGGAIAVDDVNASDGEGDVELTATGAITESGVDSAADIVGVNLALVAGAGIGTIGNVLETNVTSIEASGGTGGVYITDITGGLIIGGVSAGLGGVTATGGNIAITAMSPLTVNEPVNLTGGGNISLSAAGTVGDDDLTINADLTVTGAGNINLATSDDIVTGAATTISAPGGQVAITADVVDDDAGTGSSVTLAGAIQAGSLSITTGPDGDTITITGTVPGATTVTAGAGDDTVILSNPIQDLFGNGGVDTVVLKVGSSITGTFAGGAGYDAIIYDHDEIGGDDYVGTVTANLQTGTATDVAAFTGIERIETTNAAGDTLTGVNAASVWQITDDNAGNIGGAGVFDFVGFGNLTGGTNDDTFEFGEDGNLSGDLDGGSGFNSLDYDASDFDAAVTVVLDLPIGGEATAIDGRFDNMDEVIGDEDFADENALTGSDTAVLWTSTGINAGNIDSVFFYENFGTITGGADDETYALDDGVIPDGIIDGGDGDNTLDLSAWTGDIIWYITGDNAGTVVTPSGSFSFAHMGNLLSGEGDDSFFFSDARILTYGFDGGDGQDSADVTEYDSQNIWTGSNLSGQIATQRGNFVFTSIEDIKDGLVTTMRFKTYDLIGSFGKLGLPTEIVQGANGWLNLVIGNDGNSRVTGRIAVSYYLSLDGVLDASDVLVATKENLRVDLFPGRTRNTRAFAAVPAGTAPGTYKVLAFIDSVTSIAEANELNNVVVSAGDVEVIQPVQDLSAAFTRMTLPSGVVPGTDGSIVLRVTNNGNVPVTSPFGVDYYLSTDATIDGGDVLMLSNDNWDPRLAAGDSAVQRSNVTIPLGTPAGTYFVLAKVDADAQVVESNEANNVATAVDTVTVVDPVIDLSLASSRVVLPATAVPGDSGRFVVTIENLGNIIATGRIGIDIYASVDGVIGAGDVLVATSDLRAINIAPNGDVTFTLPVALTDALLPATYQWLVSIDSDGAIAESNEANNIQPLDTSTELVWKFGNFDGRRNVKLTVHDSFGVPANFSMHGNGYGSVLGGAAFDEIVIVGTNNHSVASVRTTGPVAQANNVTIRQPIGTFYAPNLQVNGRLMLNDTARRVIINNPPVVSVTATDALAAETLVGDPADTGLFTITRDTTFSDLIVGFSLAGKGVLNRDYTLSVGGVTLATNSVAMAYGQSSVQVLLTVLDDSRVEPAELAKLSLRPGVGYIMDPAAANRRAAVTIQDNEA